MDIEITDAVQLAMTLATLSVEADVIAGCR